MENNSYAYAETLEVLENMSEVYINKIPNKLIQYIKDNSSRNYIKHIVPYKPLAEQRLNRKTLAILAMINLKYWTKSEKHKEVLLNKHKNVKQNKIEYNDEIFTRKENISLNTEKLAISNLKKETIFTKIINWIKNQRRD